MSLASYQTAPPRVLFADDSRVPGPPRQPQILAYARESVKRVGNWNDRGPTCGKRHAESLDLFRVRSLSRACHRIPERLS
jgi:hypothetical protein